MGPARKTTTRASAHSARVIGRYPPVPLRTAESSRPTSPWAASTRLSLLHRVPATCTTSAKVVSCGAKTRSAVSSVGRRRRRRTSRHRRQPGSGGAARGSQRHSYQRGPVVPAPALRRVQPSGGSAATRVCTCRGRPSSRTYAWPETASPSAWGGPSSPSRSGRAWPYTRSPVTHGAGLPAAQARARLGWARCGWGATSRSSGIPADRQRSRSLVHSSGR
jgi:hypothetical protein